MNRAVRIETVAPETTIDSGPADGIETGSTSATYGFSSEAGASFECSTDDGAFAPCSSPASLTDLDSGAHSFAVRGIDAAGNTDPSAARRTLRVDADPPETKVKKPKAKGRKVTLKFSANEKGSTFECKLDKGKFRPCKSPKTYKKLDEGKHEVLVLATDAIGNEERNAAKAKFRIG